MNVIEIILLAIVTFILINRNRLSSYRCLSYYRSYLR